MTPVKTLRQASEPFTHPPPPKTKQDSFVTDVFGLFRFLSVLYMGLRILLRFFSRHFIDSPSDAVNALDCRRSEGQTAPHFTLAQRIVPVNRNTTRYLLWCDSRSEASHT